MVLLHKTFSTAMDICFVLAVFDHFELHGMRADLFYVSLHQPYSCSYGAGLRPKDADHQSIQESGYSSQSMHIDPTRVVQLSWSPRAFLYEGFLSDEECDHLISLAHGRLKKSLVIDPATEKHVMSANRSSSGIFIAKGQDEIVTQIEDRIAAWTLLPQGTDVQGSMINKQAGEPQAKDGKWSECGKTSYAVRPIKGNALLFFNLHPNATADKNGIHAGCPVIEGEKWTATKWIHVKSVDLETLSSSDDGGECTDEDASCAQWAELGECQKNPVFMIGSPDYYGTCRKSCKVC
ncbi:hypothetical protein ACLOJK_021289 [Asimina triloba]